MAQGYEGVRVDIKQSYLPVPVRSRCSSGDPVRRRRRMVGGGVRVFCLCADRDLDDRGSARRRLCSSASVCTSAIGNPYGVFIYPGGAVAAAMVQSVSDTTHVER